MCLSVFLFVLSTIGWQDTSGAGNPDVSSTDLSAAAGARGRYHHQGQTEQVKQHCGVCPFLNNLSLCCSEKAAFDGFCS